MKKVIVLFNKNSKFSSTPVKYKGDAISILGNKYYVYSSKTVLFLSKDKIEELEKECAYCPDMNRIISKILEILNKNWENEYQPFYIDKETNIKQNIEKAKEYFKENKNKDKTLKLFECYPKFHSKIGEGNLSHVNPELAMNCANFCNTDTIYFANNGIYLFKSENLDRIALCLALSP